MIPRKIGARDIMSELDMYERIQALLHKATLDDTWWIAASELIDIACKAKGSYLAFGEGTVENGINIFFSRLCYHGQRNLELECDYYENYYAIDERLPRIRQLPDSSVTHNSDLFIGEEIKTSHIYNEICLRSETQNSLNVSLDGLDGLSRIFWTICDPVDAGSWSSAQVEMIRRLLPHIRQFMGIRQTLSDAKALGNSLASLLHNSSVGVIQLDARRRIVATNDSALAILRQGDGLSDEGGTVQATSKDSQAEFNKMLTRALPRFRDQGESGSMVVERSNALSRLVLHVTPVQNPQGGGRAQRIAALMLVVDPMSHARIDPFLIEWAFGLTPAESQLAALLTEGKTLRDIATLMKRSEGTIRWHLKQIFRKTGLSRQVELVQLILSIADIPTPRN